MHLKDIIQKKNNLENIRVKVNNDKNILLITIMKLTKKLSFYLDNSLLNIQLINALKNKYSIKNNFVSSQNSKLINNFQKILIKDKELYIYLTEEQKYGIDSYTRYETTILENIKNKNADFILIGEKPIQFGAKNKLSVVKEFKNSSHKGLAKILTQLTKILFLDSIYIKKYTL
ncbi:hypothetical protein NWQ34_05300 [Mycoplasmopsis felis]|uniref:MSC_0622 family F1-like ATPase gamma subunit n=1 Tax=Mycoplasmopsis felis TaxID=33923 RepID=UPI0021E0595F|nr:hypothetical protein [Mycoplasmopsis felis]MCU9938986.1 hypothetical protein [Mycoplasmopsis felis]